MQGIGVKSNAKLSVASINNKDYKSLIANFLWWSPRFSNSVTFLKFQNGAFLSPHFLLYMFYSLSVWCFRIAPIISYSIVCAYVYGSIAFWSRIVCWNLIITRSNTSLLIAQDGVTGRQRQRERTTKWCIVCNRTWLLIVRFSPSVERGPFIFCCRCSASSIVFVLCFSLSSLRMNFNVCWPMKFSLFQYLWLSLCRSFFNFCSFVQFSFSFSFSLFLTYTHSSIHSHLIVKRA